MTRRKIVTIDELKRLKQAYAKDGKLANKSSMEFLRKIEHLQKEGLSTRK